MAVEWKKDLSSPNPESINPAESPDMLDTNFEEPKTETEKILGEKEISHQLDLVLSIYDHTPSIK
jgi:hypothetical protein